MAVDILLQGAEAFGNLGNSLGAPIGLSMRKLGGSVVRDDRHLLAQVMGDLFGGGGLQRVQLLQEAEEQQPRAQGVDLAWHTPSVPMDHWKTILGELRIVFPVGPAQPMLDIGSGLDFAQWSQVVSRRYALPQLLQ